MLNLRRGGRFAPRRCTLLLISERCWELTIAVIPRTHLAIKSNFSAIDRTRLSSVMELLMASL